MPRLLTVLLLITGWAGPIAAAESADLAVAGGIAAIVPLNGIGDGIATIDDTGPLAVRHADGSLARIMLVSGRLVLEPLGSEATPGTVRAGMLPDGEIALGRRGIGAAWLVGPTDRYPHGILGDRIEASGVRAEIGDGRVGELVLPRGSVFEDRRARLADLDGDGQDEIIVVRSYRDLGAALAVVGVVGDGLKIVAESAPIGRSSRWLNPAGVADFDGDGVLEVAHIETPHIGGILRVHELRDGAMVLDYSAGGFSNHAIGTREQDMSAVGDWNGDGVPDIAIPDAQRRALRLVTLAGLSGRFASWPGSSRTAALSRRCGQATSTATACRRSSTGSITGRWLR